MNTQEFMEAVGLPNAQAVTYYIKNGVITPKKVLRSYQYTEVEVNQYKAYKRGEMPKPAKSSENLNHSTPKPEQAPRTEGNSEFIEGEKMQFTHNCWGEPYDTQLDTESLLEYSAISPATYTETTLKMFFKDWRDHENDNVFEHLNYLCKYKFGVDVRGFKTFYNYARANNNELLFDQCFMPSFTYDGFYSYNDVTNQLKELKIAKPFSPDWPDIETYTASFLIQYSLSGLSRLSVFDFISGRLTLNSPPNKITNILMYENPMMQYYCKEADTFPDTWHKTTKVYHGDNVPKKLNSIGKSKFPDKWENLRYERYGLGLLKQAEPMLPTDKPITDIPSDEFASIIAQQKLYKEFKTYYGLS